MKKLYYSLLVVVPMLAAPHTILAQSDDPYGVNDLGDAGVELGDADINDTIASIINIVLSFLGVLATLIILFGGFKWMTSQGNTEKVDEARKLIGAGIVGLVIILAAYAIAKFVLGSLENEILN